MTHDITSIEGTVHNPADCPEAINARVRMLCQPRTVHASVEDTVVPSVVLGRHWTQKLSQLRTVHVSERLVASTGSGSPAN